MTVLPSRGLFSALPLLATTLSSLACPSAPPPGLDDAQRSARVQEMWEEVQRATPDVPSVTPEELLSSDEDVVFVDDRTPEERAVSTIPGAITPEELESHAQQYRGREIVTYCTIGYRSAYYTEELRKQGWSARNLAGSILAWTHAGGTLVDPEGRPTHRVHVYGKAWNLAPRDYEAVW